MKITVIGTGYVGLIAGVCFADFGYDVVCMDTDEGKIEKLKNGVCPIYEPGAEAILKRGIKNDSISFTSDAESAMSGADVVFITVGTPSDDNGKADMSSYYAALGDIADNMSAPLVIVNKSTVPIGTGAAAREFVKERLAARGADIEFSVASNPEFLREGKSVGDFLNPDRIVIGTDNKATEEKLLELYSVFNRSNKPIITANIETAEMIKYASNAFLATKIGFINEIANLCTATGADVNEVAHAMGMDGRISPKFLHAGPGYGGSCFPKDTRALVGMAEGYGVNMSIVGSVIASNERQKFVAAKRIIDNLPAGSTLAVLGLSFKPDTDDVRESPALEVVRHIIRNSDIKLRLYDPEAVENARRELENEGAERITWCTNTEECLEGSGAAAVLTEWMEFRNLRLFDKDWIHTVFDLRNTFNKSDVAKMNKRYFGTGV